MLVTAGPGFGQELLLGDPHLTWAEIGGAGGTLEGIGRDDQPTVCATWGPLTYPDPLLHPKPTNPDGSAADCSRPGVDALADGPISVKDAMSGTASAIATWAHNPFSDVQEYLLELEAEATVDTVQPGTSVAEVNSGVSYYEENKSCACPGAQASLTLDAGGQATSTSFGPSTVSVRVITASQVARQDDTFNIDTSNHLVSLSTTPLRIGPSGNFSVLITLGATQQGQGSTHGRVYSVEKPGLVTDYKPFDPPASAGTLPRAIKDGEETLSNFAASTGSYTTSGGATQGFKLRPIGKFKAPIIDPNDNLHYTAALGINNAGTIVGQYENSNGVVDTYHGFLLSPDGAFSTYDIGKPGVSTGIQAINNNGDFAGEFGSSTRVTHGFLNSGGKTVTFGVPGLITYPQAMNDSKTIVGIYLDKSGNYQSFQRTADGTLTTFNFPGAVSTHAEGINNAGTIDGYFIDTAGKNSRLFRAVGTIPAVRPSRRGGHLRKRHQQCGRRHRLFCRQQWSAARIRGAALCRRRFERGRGDAGRHLLRQHNP